MIFLSIVLSISRFIRYTKIILPYMIFLFIVFFILGILITFSFSPEDYVQGRFVRIMYLHIPSAWISMMAYSLIAILSIPSLIWNNILTAIVARSASLIGMFFTVICLITGSIWGKNTWGTWWVWDARLTSTLILFFLYVCYLLLFNFFKNENRAVKSASIFALFSVINIPIIKFSVNIWTTLHQPSSILREGGISIDFSMMIPLLIMLFSFSCLFFILLIIRTYTLINLRKINIKLLAKNIEI